MKKFILPIIILIIAINFSGCKAKQNEISEDIKINLPKDNTVNGYRIKNSSVTYPNIIEESKVKPGDVSQNTISADYCGNKNSKVFHKSSCSSVENMKKENCIYLPSREEFINKSYSPCKRCNP